MDGELESEWRPGCKTTAVIIWRAHGFEVIQFHVLHIIRDCPALLISSSASPSLFMAHNSTSLPVVITYWQNTLRHSKLTTDTLTRTHSN